jgi:hypothetical protein
MGGGGFVHGSEQVGHAGGFLLFELGRGGGFVDDENGGVEGLKSEISQISGAVAAEDGAVVAAMARASRKSGELRRQLAMVLRWMPAWAAAAVRAAPLDRASTTLNCWGVRKGMGITCGFTIAGERERTGVGGRRGFELRR